MRPFEREDVKLCVIALRYTYDMNGHKIKGFRMRSFEHQASIQQ